MTQKVFTQTFGVVAAIIEKDGKILLVKEKKDTAKNKWNHPAGWIDLEENAIDAVKREVKEETGYDFEPKNILGFYVLVKLESGAIHHAIKMVFTGKISENQDEYAEDEISETRWFTPEEIYSMGSELRDVDIKKMVKDYFSGAKYPLDLIIHTIQPK
jgi:ADP-ribose pyrophosphatase YjhB (NUDIX family)